MHIPTAAPSPANAASIPLAFAWLELTNRCNLHCVHCYAESGPTTGQNDLLDEDDYLNLIDQLSNLGCRQIQFIGGEPTLNKGLPKLIEAAYQKDFELIEVFTNLTHLPQELLDVFSRFNVSVATSFYSDNPTTHDHITRHQGSFDRTTRNMRRVLDAGLQLRAAIIEMEQNQADIVATWEFLSAMGVKQIGSDHVRKIGRADLTGSCDMKELCGSCAGATICISPNGTVSPCIMSKKWSVGSCIDTPLTDFVFGSQLCTVRKEIYDTVVAPREQNIRFHGQCDPSKPCFPCGPDAQCPPCSPNTSCNPNHCRPYCMPN